MSQSLPLSATLIEQTRPNAKGEGVIQIHAVGCQHQNRVADDLIHYVAPEDQYLDYGFGVEGALAYLIALRSGMLDDGVVNCPWVSRFAPCAKQAASA